MKSSRCSSQLRSVAHVVLEANNTQKQADKCMRYHMVSHGSPMTDSHGIQTAWGPAHLARWGDFRLLASSWSMDSVHAMPTSQGHLLTTLQMHLALFRSKWSLLVGLLRLYQQLDKAIARLMEAHKHRH